MMMKNKTLYVPAVGQQPQRESEHVGEERIMTDAVALARVNVCVCVCLSVRV